MNFYTSILRPLLFRLPAETAHELSLELLGLGSRVPGLLRLLFGSPARNPVEVCGIVFPNAVGLAAGMDKNAVALSAWEQLGFGFLEVGTVTAHAQPGNPRPRLFRYPSRHALVNRMGFNNEGCDVVARRLEGVYSRGRRPGVPLGINLGKSKITELSDAPGDYLRSYRTLYAFGDYFVVNVSSPNTPGLRSLQAADELEKIVKTLRDWESDARKPLFVKLAPDLAAEDASEAVRIAEAAGASGFIATNTTLDHSSLAGLRDETGGLSGIPLRQKALDFLRHIRGETALPIIASGGVFCAADALERQAAGACLVQLYTGFVYRGPSLVHDIARRIICRCDGGQRSDRPTN